MLLKATWPTHQKLWEGQATKNVKKIEKEILTWNVNPDLTDQEVQKIINVINSFLSNSITP
jgi:dTDP-4-amino-4,6-dideoxygalactose transaminase